MGRLQNEVVTDDCFSFVNAQRAVPVSTGELSHMQSGTSVQLVGLHVSENSAALGCILRQPGTRQDAHQTGEDNFPVSRTQSWNQCPSLKGRCFVDVGKACVVGFEHRDPRRGRKDSSSLGREQQRPGGRQMRQTHPGANHSFLYIQAEFPFQ